MKPGTTSERRLSAVMFVLGLALCVLSPRGTDAWGGLFNRFSPEMLANMGYGANGYSQPTSLQHTRPGHEFGEVETSDDDPCFERSCLSENDCCPLQYCIAYNQDYGRCFYAQGRRAGELCERDSDCESGLLCGGPAGHTDLSRHVCQAPTFGDKQYGENCHSSGQCDISRGLCCILQRRHRQAPRKVCSYFKDPLVCIGPVAADQVKNSIEHTAGEKRIIGYKHLN